MNLSELQRQIFAILFAAGDPLESDRLAETLHLSPAEASEQCGLIAGLLERSGLPIELRRLEDSWQLCTGSGYGSVIREALELKRNAPLSGAAMEVLAVVAYGQPVTRGFIEQVRGVDSSSVVTSLTEKGLIEEAGRLDLPGRPIAFRTTSSFLRCFGLTDLSELPDLRDDGPEDGAPPETDEMQIAFEELAVREEETP